MKISVISGKCKIESCMTGKFSLDPCDELSYYTCDNLNQNRLSCAKGTHFTKNNTCNFLTTPSAKSEIWKTCGFPENFSKEQCRKIWPKKTDDWDKTKINDFLTSANSSTTTKTETSPQKDIFLIPFLIVFFILIAIVVIIIFLLRRRNYCKRPNSNRDKDDQQTEKKEENEEPIYAEIDVNCVRRPSIPAVEANLPKIDQALDSNPEHLYASKGFTSDEDNQEEVYNVVYAPGMHQNGKSSEMLPGEYSSENIDSEKYPDNPYFVLEKESVN